MLSKTLPKHKLRGKVVLAGWCLLLAATEGWVWHAQAEPPGGGDPFASPAVGVPGVAALPMPPPESHGLDERRLLQIQHSMLTSGDHGPLDEAHRQRRLHMIQHDPDLGPYLVQIVDQLLQSRQFEAYAYLDAMAQRRDVDPQDIARFTRKAAEFLKVRSRKDLGRSESNYLAGMVKIFAAHPTEENLNVLIRMQELGFGALAAEGLAQSRNPLALPSLEKVVSEAQKMVRDHPGNESFEAFLKQMNGYLDTLRDSLP